MNILIINSHPFISSFGGVERVSVTLGNGLIKFYGHNVYFMSCRPFEKEIENEQFPLQHYFLPQKGLFDNEENLVYYKSFLKEKKIDIVLNQAGLWDWMNNALLITNIKVVSVLHSIPKASFFLELQSGLSHKNTFYSIIKYYTKMLFYPLFLMYWKRKLWHKLIKHYQFLSEHSNAIVTLSYADEVELKRLRLNKKCFLTHIPNLNTFKSTNSHFEKEKIILFVGRLSFSEKNPLRVLEIWKKIYQDFPNWKLVIVGDGEAWTAMHCFVVNNHLERVDFTGHVKNVAFFYKRASFILLTSDFEGWGMTLTEGMNYGCIPFSFKSYGAATDIIDDGENGCLITPYSIEEYVLRLRLLMSDDFLRERMSLAAQQKSLSFSPDKILCKWNKLLTSI